MKLKFFKPLYLLVAIFGLFFLTKNWFSNGTYIAGHDSGLALNTWEFLKSRTFAWNVQNFGQDNSPHFGSLIMYTVDFITSKLAGVPYGGNYINVFFWLSAIFITAFVFAYSLKKELGNYFPYIFAPFVTINFFIIQSLFVLERAKYSILIADLLILTIIFKIDKGLISYKKSFVLLVLILFLFNSGSWLGLPLYGSMAVLVGGFILVKLVNLIQKKNWSEGVRFLLFWVATGLGFILINAYSIFPYIVTFIKSDAAKLVSPEVVGQNVSWLRSISQAGSFINFLRLQGIPDWYSGVHEANIQHAFAGEYLKNPVLIISSFIFPVLALLAVVFAKNRSKKYVTCFLVFTLLSMFFMAGSHPPLGSFYELLYRKVPGFAIFRSPYYKFTSAFLIGYLGLISFALSYLVEKLSKKFGITFTLAIIGIWFVYHGVLFDRSKVFSWQGELSTQLLLPERLQQFSSDLINLNIQDSRVLLVPPVNRQWQNDAYDWGYWSLTNLPSILSPSINFVANDGNLFASERFWVDDLYKSIEIGDENRFLSVSKRLHIKYILLRDDVLKSDSWSGTKSPGLYKDNLNKFDSVSVKGIYSDWIVYAVNGVNSEKFVISDNFVFAPDEKVSVVSNYLVENEHVLSGENFGSQKFSVAECQSCTAELKVPNDSLPEITILPNSKLYFIKELKEEKVLRLATDEEGKAFDYLGLALRRTSEVMIMMRDYIKEEYVVSDLATIESYLKKVNSYLITNSDPNNDFSIYARLQDSLLPIETNLRNQAGEGSFGKRSEALRKGVYSVLWQIRSINDYFSPISDTLNVFRERKIFSLKFDEAGEYKIHLNHDTLPLGEDGEVVYPEALEVKIEDETLSLEPVEERQGVFFEANIRQKGTYETVLVFKNLPDLYQEYGYSLNPTPFGDNTCNTGKIKFYNKNSSYRVSFSVLDKTQRLKFYVKSLSTDPKKVVDFLRGDIEEGIDPADNSQFSYLYKPYGAPDPEFFICKYGKENPVISGVRIYEIVNPSLIIEKVEEQGYIQQDRFVDYKMINPTKYEVNVDFLKEGEILIFKEKYSPLWRIIEDGEAVEGVDHVMVDAYANGWIMPKYSSGKYVVEYVPQEGFRKGLIVTVASFLILLVTEIWREYKK